MIDATTSISVTLQWEDTRSYLEVTIIDENRVNESRSCNSVVAMVQHGVFDDFDVRTRLVLQYVSEFWW